MKAYNFDKALLKFKKKKRHLGNSVYFNGLVETLFLTFWNMKPLSSNTNCGLDPKRQVECIANIFPTCLKWMEMEHIQRDLPSIFHNALN